MVAICAVALGGGLMALGYATDIRPLFRDNPDIACMDRRGVHLGDSVWMCNQAHAQRVYAKLQAGEMPPDGPWSTAQIALYKRWMDEGCLP